MNQTTFLLWLWRDTWSFWSWFSGWEEFEWSESLTGAIEFWVFFEALKCFLGRFYPLKTVLDPYLGRLYLALRLLGNRRFPLQNASVKPWRECCRQCHRTLTQWISLPSIFALFIHRRTLGWLGAVSFEWLCYCELHLDFPYPAKFHKIILPRTLTCVQGSKCAVICVWIQDYYSSSEL